MAQKDKTTSHETTALASEVARFASLADQWWDVEGDFAPLHKINPIRLTFIRDHLCAYFGRDPKQQKPLNNLSIIDIGCGGGLLCEPLARLGAQVMGIDAGDENIRIAKIHAKRSGLDILYRQLLPEDVAAEQFAFDIVLNMEVIEHVADRYVFMEACCALVKPGGLMVSGTLNRTLKSLAFAKIGAEYILQWLPHGSHDWRNFVKPSELSALLRRNDFTIADLKGLTYNLLYDEWALTSDLKVNYLILAQKNEIVSGL